MVSGIKKGILWLLTENIEDKNGKLLPDVLKKEFLNAVQYHLEKYGELPEGISYNKKQALLTEEGEPETEIVFREKTICLYPDEYILSRNILVGFTEKRSQKITYQ